MTTIALVTGANKGIGREAVRRLSDSGWTVLLGARDHEQGAVAAAELAAAGGDVHIIDLDVTSQESVDEAVDHVAAEYGRLDVLINNAGIGGASVSPQDTRAEHLRDVYETNVFGPVRVTGAFLPLLDKSDSPRVVMVGSGLGSLAVTTDPDRLESTVVDLGYPSSKAALHMITTMYAKALPTYRVNVVDPGFTATDLNGHRGHQTVEEGAQAITAMAMAGPHGPTGTLMSRHGPVPW